jgi:hypothetical protein
MNTTHLKSSTNIITFENNFKACTSYKKRAGTSEAGGSGGSVSDSCRYYIVRRADINVNGRNISLAFD